MFDDVSVVFFLFIVSYFFSFLSFLPFILFSFLGYTDEKKISNLLCKNIKKMNETNHLIFSINWSIKCVDLFRCEKWASSPCSSLLPLCFHSAILQCCRMDGIVNCNSIVASWARMKYQIKMDYSIIDLIENNFSLHEIPFHDSSHCIVAIDFENSTLIKIVGTHRWLFRLKV